jgi:hypothetical protein
MPVYLRAVHIDYEDSWSSGNVIFLKNFITGFFSPGGNEENKISVQKLLIFLVGEELLTQQYTRPSATREKVDEDFLSFILRLTKGLVKIPLEPVLGESCGNKHKKNKRYNSFFHHVLLQFLIYKSLILKCQIEKFLLCWFDKKAL